MKLIRRSRVALVVFVLGAFALALPACLPGGATPQSKTLVCNSARLTITYTTVGASTVVTSGTLTSTGPWAANQRSYAHFMTTDPAVPMVTVFTGPLSSQSVSVNKTVRSITVKDPVRTCDFQV